MFSTVLDFHTRYLPLCGEGWQIIDLKGDFPFTLIELRLRLVSSFWLLLFPSHLWNYSDGNKSVFFFVFFFCFFKYTFLNDVRIRCKPKDFFFFFFFFKFPFLFLLNFICFLSQILQIQQDPNSFFFFFFFFTFSQSLILKIFQVVRLIIIKGFSIVMQDSNVHVIESLVRIELATNWFSYVPQCIHCS